MPTINVATLLLMNAHSCDKKCRAESTVTPRLGVTSWIIFWDYFVFTTLSSYALGRTFTALLYWLNQSGFEDDIGNNVRIMKSMILLFCR